MNTVARAWQAALTALKEARDLHERRAMLRLCATCCGTRAK
jgi:hypothetical protein